MEHLEAELDAAERNEKAFLELKENYVREIEHLKNITERYQEYYESELNTKSISTEDKRATIR